MSEFVWPLPNGTEECSLQLRDALDNDSFFD